jgi:hypothetical protein
LRQWPDQFSTKSGATEVAQPELTTLVNFNVTNGSGPAASLIADAKGDLFGTTHNGGTSAGPNNAGYGTVFEITDSGFSTHKAPSCSVLE